MPSTVQPELFAARRSETGLSALLARESGLRVAFVFTRNRVSMLSIRFGPGGTVRVRADRAFGEAPEPVVEALGRYLRTRRSADWQPVSRYARGVQPAGCPPAPRQLLTRGRVHDLGMIRDHVNRTYFHGRLHCAIGWGARGRRQRRGWCRTIRYGSYVKAQNLVRINPLLDDPRVPAEFVAYIVFHEMLHAVVPSQAGLRYRHHHAVYRHLERRFPDYARMQRLSSELVDVLVAR